MASRAYYFDKTVLQARENPPLSTRLHAALLPSCDSTSIKAQMLTLLHSSDTLDNISVAEGLHAEQHTQ